eukprot:PhM_4_TR3624/c0_g1_i1/m.84260
MSGAEHGDIHLEERDDSPVKGNDTDRGGMYEKNDSNGADSDQMLLDEQQHMEKPKTRIANSDLAVSMKKRENRGGLMLAVGLPSLYIIVVALVALVGLRSDTIGDSHDNNLRDHMEKALVLVDALVMEQTAAIVSYREATPVVSVGNSIGPLAKAFALAMQHTDAALNQLVLEYNLHTELFDDLKESIRLDSLREVRVGVQQQADGNWVTERYREIARTLLYVTAQHHLENIRRPFGVHVFRTAAQAIDAVGLSLLDGAATIPSAFDSSYALRGILAPFLRQLGVDKSTYVHAAFTPLPSSNQYTISYNASEAAVLSGQLSPALSYNMSLAYNITDVMASVRRAIYETIGSDVEVREEDTVLGGLFTMVVLAGFMIICVVGSYASLLASKSRELVYDRTLQNHEHALEEMNEFVELLEELGVDELMTKKMTTTKESEVLSQALGTVKEISPYYAHTLLRAPPDAPPELAASRDTEGEEGMALCMYRTRYPVFCACFDLSPFHQNFATAGKKQKTLHHNIVHIVSLIEEEFEPHSAVVRVGGTTVTVYVGLYGLVPARSVCDAVSSVQQSAISANVGHIRACLAVQPANTFVGNVGNDVWRSPVVLGEVEQQCRVVEALNRIHDTYFSVTHSVAAQLRDSSGIEIRPMEVIKIEGQDAIEVCEYSRRRDRDDPSLVAWKKLFDSFSHDKFSEAMDELVDYTKMYGSSQSTTRVATLIKARHHVSDAKEVLMYDLFLVEHS